MNKKELIILIGLPGSGKSTYAEYLKETHTILSSDAMRAEFGKNESDQSVTPIVFRVLEERFKKFLQEGKNIIIDATNVTIKDRSKYIQLAKTNTIQYEINCCYFPHTKEVLVERNQKRGLKGGRDVPTFVIEKMLNKLQPPTKNEGFDTVKIMS